MPPNKAEQSLRRSRENFTGLKDSNIFGQMGLVLVGVIAAVIYARQLQEMKRTNDLTQQALSSGSDTLSKTLDKMQGQIDATNHVYGETQKQTAQAEIMAKNSATQAGAARDAVETARHSLLVNAHSERAWIGL